MDELIQRAADAVRSAQALVITAGAGMGVDSGLPDFRGDGGFWKAYPMYQRLGLSFVQAANPVHFEGDPAFGWGFYGHRTNLYRSTVPHDGYRMLQEWSAHFGLDTFVVTSNVDGQFQKAGFSGRDILEVHGTIHYLQCTRPCSDAIWPNDGEIRVNHETMRAENVPLCPKCNRPARPNILMFNDYSWISNRTGEQEDRFEAFLQANRTSRLAVIEIGAGTAVPTIRALSERLGSTRGATVIRINPRESHIRGNHIALPMGALESLTLMDKALS